MHDTSEPIRFTLRQLPCAARLTLAAFLVSVGIGYFSALVQLHFQHAQAGQPIPTGDDAEKRFHPRRGSPSRLEALLDADPTFKFGPKSMRGAFVRPPSSINKAVRKRMQELEKKGEPADKAAVEAAIREEREGERLAMLAWIRSQPTEEQYATDRFQLPDDLQTRPLTAEMVHEDNGVKYLKVSSLVKARCLDCHSEGGEAGNFPLDTFAKLQSYTVPGAGTAMSLNKLAQTTHVHLLGFAMLYTLTGLILAFTSYPAPLRLLLAPLPLVAQVVDISLWWLARMDAPYGPMLARAIPITGAIVGAGLGLHLVLSLFDLFSRTGKLVLFILFVAAIGGGIGLKQRVIDPYLEREKAATTSTARE